MTDMLVIGVKKQESTPEVDLHHRPGIMVWGAICSNGTAFIMWITGKINAENISPSLKK